MDMNRILYSVEWETSKSIQKGERNHIYPTHGARSIDKKKPTNTYVDCILSFFLILNMLSHSSSSIFGEATSLLSFSSTLDKGVFAQLLPAIPKRSSMEKTGVFTDRANDLKALPNKRSRASGSFTRT